MAGKKKITENKYINANIWNKIKEGEGGKRVIVREKKKIGWQVIILIILAPFILRFAVGLFTGHDIEDVRAKIEEHLYKEYGEEFAVDRIGTRKYPDGKTRFIARIYPKSIIGTSREGDPYYCAQAGVEKKSFGRLGKVGAGYETVQIKLEAEKYLIDKIKEIFGERVLLKPDVKYEIRKEGNDYFSWQIVSGFEELLEKVKSDPENNRLLLDLDVYIFKRIKNEQEKEERRKEIFELVQYLKEEGLFEYLELGVIFIDERVLAPSYKKYKYEISGSRKVKEEIEGEIVRMPPRDLREEVSGVLQQEVNEMSEEELLASMRKIRKDELEYDVLDKYNATYYGLVYSAGILEVKYKSSYKKYKENEAIDHYYYKDISDIKIGKNLEYAYID
ncbi:hypothetical protein [Halocella sp. SP3-1]|uniref:hypothetical protein n=1 Tax=Halocella sp. SP3-1 TaxID=2382161 RepID=UPI000F74DE1A|nr:hypothetical protein [Halocella sp. SP3-1]AZO94099.1 hypothetical protein D7D81_05545 [Halocella sp. SP3-1]